MYTGNIEGNNNKNHPYTYAAGFYIILSGRDETVFVSIMYVYILIYYARVCVCVYTVFGLIMIRFYASACACV